MLHWRNIPRKDLLQSAVIGLLQGLACWALMTHVPQNAQSYAWKMPLICVLTLVPLGYFALAGTTHLFLLLRFLAVQALLLFSMNVYSAAIHPPGTAAAADSLAGSVLAWGISLLLFAAHSHKRSVGGAFYAALFFRAFSLASCGVLACITLLVFWLMLFLWGAVFNIVGIGLFQTLFSGKLFSALASSTVFALALTLTRVRHDAGGMMQRAARAPCIWLLPIACALALLFLLALPFTGLSALWATDHATALLAGLQLAVLGFTAAVYGDGTPATLPRWLRRITGGALLALPFYSALSIYALALRVQQYGWTIGRVHAALALTLLACAGLGYAYAALRRGRWLAPVGRVNTALAALLLAMAVLVQTPVLSPERIAASSQRARLEHGAADAETFDYAYLRDRLGRYGKDALQALAALQQHPRAETIRARAQAALEEKTIEAPADILARLTLFPEGAALEADFGAFLQAQIASGSLRPECLLLHSTGACTLLKADFNGDGKAEYALLDYNSAVFTKTAGGWEKAGNFQQVMMASEEWARRLREHHFRIENSRWNDLIIGTQRLSVWQTPNKEPPHARH